jgi:hypothetical protein
MMPSQDYPTIWSLEPLRRQISVQYLIPEISGFGEKLNNGIAVTNKNQK